MSKYVQGNDEKSWVNQGAIKADITDILFDIEDKKIVNRLRVVLKAWTKADDEVRKTYLEKDESGDKGRLRA